MQCVVESEPPPCIDSTSNGSPGSAISLGSISGDTGGSFIERTARLCGGSDSWRVRVIEQESGAFDFEALTAGSAVTPASGDPDLRVSCGGVLVGTSSLPGLAVEVLTVGNDEDAGSPDDFDVLIEVTGSAVPTDYTLLVTGDVPTTDNSCG